MDLKALRDGILWRRKILRGAPSSATNTCGRLGMSLSPFCSSCILVLTIMIDDRVESLLIKSTVCYAIMYMKLCVTIYVY